MADDAKDDATPTSAAVRDSTSTSDTTTPAQPAKKHRRSRKPRHLRNVLEDRRRRHASDVIQLVIALLWLTVATLRSGHRTGFDNGIQDLINAIPKGLDEFAKIIYFGGGVWIVAVVAILLLCWRRFEAAAQVFVAGGVAWLASGLIGWGWTGTLNFVNATIKTTPDAPVTRVAVVVAITLAASPFVPRPLRRLGIALAALVGVASMYLGYRQASAVVAGFLVGWAACKVVQLVRGTPQGLPTIAEITEAMAELNEPITELEQVAVPFGGAIRLRANGADGEPLLLEVAGRDQRDTQVLVKAWRWLNYKDSGPRLSLNRLSQLEHEAYLGLLAASHEVRVPEVITVGQAGPGTAILVTHDPEATALASLDTDAFTDAVLDDAWGEINRLHACRMAHGALTTQSTTLDASGKVWLVDLEMASSAAPATRIRRDQADFLVSSALSVGSDRAIAAAQRALSNEELVELLPLLQPAGMAPSTRKALKGKERKGFLKQLVKDGVAATGSIEPQLEQLRRVSPATLFMALGSLIAVYALIAFVGNPVEMWNQVKNADWMWVVFAACATLSTNVTYAIAIMGSAPQGAVRLGPTIVLEFATSFGSVAVPGGVGTSVFTLRYFQRMGIDIATGVTALVSSNSVSGIVQVLLFLSCLPFARTSFSLGKLPSNWPVFVLLAILVIGVLLGLIFGVPALRRRVMPILGKASTYIKEFARSPRRLVLNFGGNLGSALLSALCVDFCLRAFGHPLPFLTVIVINIGVSTISNMVPVPGGMGVGALGLTGAFVAAGVPKEAAAPAVLCQQMLVIWLPVLPGWFCTKALMKREYL